MKSVSSDSAKRRLIDSLLASPPGLRGNVLQRVISFRLPCRTGAGVLETGPLQAAYVEYLESISGWLLIWKLARLKPRDRAHTLVLFYALNVAHDPATLEPALDRLIQHLVEEVRLGRERQ